MALTVTVTVMVTVTVTVTIIIGSRVTVSHLPEPAGGHLAAGPWIMQGQYMAPKSMLQRRSCKDCDGRQQMPPNPAAWCHGLRFRLGRPGQVPTFDHSAGIVTMIVPFNKNWSSWAGNTCEGSISPKSSVGARDFS